MTLQDLQERVASMLEDVGHPRVGAVLALLEEVGELVRHVMEKEVYGEEVESRHFEEELGDILVVLCEVASHYDVDLQYAAGTAIERIEPKVDGWVDRYGARLKALRERWD